MYKSSYGRWNVTTEGDVEGRTTIQLGTHEGHIDEIALHLAKKCYYSLTFKLVEPITTFEPAKKKVNVQLDIESGTWDMKSEELVDKMKELFADRPVHVEPCNYYASFTIATEKNIREEDKKAALNKLSDYEKELLGL